MINVLGLSLSVCCLVPPVWRAAISAAWVLARISFAWWHAPELGLKEWEGGAVAAFPMDE